MKGYLLNGRLEEGLPVTMMAGREGTEKAVVVVGKCPDGSQRYVALDYKNPPEVKDGRVFEAAPVEVTVRRENGQRTFKVLQAPPLLDPDVPADLRALVLAQTKFWESSRSEGDITRVVVVPGRGTLLILEDGAVLETGGGFATNYCGDVAFCPKTHTIVRRL